jgi:hypothetical protein
MNIAFVNNTENAEIRNKRSYLAKLIMVQKTDSLIFYFVLLIKWSEKIIVINPK